MGDNRAEVERVLPRLRHDFENSRRMVARAIDRAKRLADESIAMRRLLEARVRRSDTGGALDAEIWNAAAQEILRVTHERDRELGIVAHEMRQPLAAAVAAERLLGVGNPEARTHAQAVLARQLSHLTELVETLLDYARLSGAMPVNPRRPVDMVDIAARAIESVEASAVERQQDVRFHCDAPSAPVAGDAIRLRQALVNLLQNAIRYSPERAGVDLSLIVDDGAVRIDIADTGEGIAAESLEKIFDPFVRVSVSGPGLGIGLALVRRVAELHGGTVAVRSDGPGHGSVFTLRIPLARGDRHGA